MNIRIDLFCFTIDRLESELLCDFGFTYETHTFTFKYLIDQRVRCFLLANETIRPNKVYIEETLTKARALPESRVKMSILIFL